MNYFRSRYRPFTPFRTGPDADGRGQGRPRLRDRVLFNSLRSKVELGYSVIGNSYIGPDVPPKATCTTKFTGDLPLPGMLYGKILRSPYPHARIVRIDVSQALKHPGIQAVITGADLPPRKYGLAPNVTADRFPLAKDRARFVGEEIAALAAMLDKNQKTLASPSGLS